MSVNETYLNKIKYLMHGNNLALEVIHGKQPIVLLFICVTILETIILLYFETISFLLLILKLLGFPEYNI